MSGWVITLAYIKQPIISLYLAFQLGVSRFGEMALEPGVRFIPGSISIVTA